MCLDLIKSQGVFLFCFVFVVFVFGSFALVSVSASPPQSVTAFRYVKVAYHTKAEGAA